MTPTPKSEPVLTATLLAPVVAWALAYFGFQVDPLLATQIAGGVLAVGSVAARSRVMPVAKVQNAAKLGGNASPRHPNWPTSPPTSGTSSGGGITPVIEPLPHGHDRPAD